MRQFDAAPSWVSEKPVTGRSHFSAQQRGKIFCALGAAPWWEVETSLNGRYEFLGDDAFPVLEYTTRKRTGKGLLRRCRAPAFSFSCVLS